MTPADALRKAADTYEQRSAVYGENYRRVGAVLKAMFPQGIELKTEAEFLRFYLLVLTTLKHCRYTENFFRGGHEDSCIDNSVYYAIIAAVDEEINSKAVDQERGK